MFCFFVLNCYIVERRVKCLYSEDHSPASKSGLKSTVNVTGLMVLRLWVVFWNLRWRNLGITSCCTLSLTDWLIVLTVFSYMNQSVSYINCHTFQEACSVSWLAEKHKPSQPWLDWICFLFLLLSSLAGHTDLWPSFRISFLQPLLLFIALGWWQMVEHGHLSKIGSVVPRLLICLIYLHISCILIQFFSLLVNYFYSILMYLSKFSLFLVLYPSLLVPLLSPSPLSSFLFNRRIHFYLQRLDLLPTCVRVSPVASEYNQSACFCPGSASTPLKWIATKTSSPLSLP